jgi:hypothetical protein
MKKTRIIAISLLGLLLFVPFIGFSRAQVPSHVGLTEGQHEEWDGYIYKGPTDQVWAQWKADNMTARWSEAFGHTYYDSMEAVYNLTDKAPIAPQFTMFYTVESIIPDTGGFDDNSDAGITPDETWASPGETLINMSSSSGTFMDFSGWPYYDYFENGTGIFMANTTAGFAEDIGYGDMATSAIWATNMFNTGNMAFLGWRLDMNKTNTILFAPNNVNWTEFKDLVGLNLGFPVWLATGYSIKCRNLTNGFMLHSGIGDFVQNTENINVTVTYDPNGLLTYYGFDYGSETLVEIFYADSTYPVITVSPSDLVLDHDYTGESLSWTATDANPDEYAILQNGSAVVFPTAWTSGGAIVYNIPDHDEIGGLAPGYHSFQINIGDSRPNRPNVASDTVLVRVLPGPVPPIPGYEPLVVIGIISAMTAGTIYIMKKRNK